jgi:putative oxidoreductase
MEENRAMKTFLFGSQKMSSALVDGALVPLRAFAGLALAAGFGMSKFPVPQWFIEDVGNLGFPFPVVFAWAAVLAEVVGGLLLALGLFTRPAALSIVATMLVAVLLQKAGDPLWERLPSLFFLAVAYYSLILGSGRFGLDAVIRRKRR